LKHAAVLEACHPNGQQPVRFWLGEKKIA